MKWEALFMHVVSHPPSRRGYLRMRAQDERFALWEMIRKECMKLCFTTDTGRSIEGKKIAV